MDARTDVPKLVYGNWGVVVEVTAATATAGVALTIRVSMRHGSFGSSEAVCIDTLRTGSN